MDASMRSSTGKSIEGGNRPDVHGGPPKILSESSSQRSDLGNSLCHRLCLKWRSRTSSSRASRANFEFPSQQGFECLWGSSGEVGSIREHEGGRLKFGRGRSHKARLRTDSRAGGTVCCQNLAPRRKTGIVAPMSVRS